MIEINDKPLPDKLFVSNIKPEKSVNNQTFYPEDLYKAFDNNSEGRELYFKSSYVLDLLKEKSIEEIKTLISGK